MNNKESTDQKQDINSNITKNAQSMNKSGIDYIWGSDQDELVENQDKGE